MNLIKNSNIAIAFLIEIFAIFILGYWGVTLQTNRIICIAVGLLAPIIMIVVWSIWCAPSSNYRLEDFWLIVLRCLLFGVVVCCLLSMKQTPAAIVFGSMVVINVGLSSYFGTL